MSAENPTPKAIWIITEEVAETSNTTTETVTKDKSACLDLVVVKPGEKAQ
ncbi:hypothetical protein H6G64_23010 [Calothrix sp. FACHB-156]|nr:hypothetical protein [Calothrix sp. FACHB-156]